MQMSSGSRAAQFSKQNLTFPASNSTTAYLVLRDGERVDFVPSSDDVVNRSIGRKAHSKENMGVLEATADISRITFPVCGWMLLLFPTGRLLRVLSSGLLFPSAIILHPFLCGRPQRRRTG